MVDKEKEEMAKKVANKVTKRIIYVALAVVVTLFLLKVCANVLVSQKRELQEYFIDGMEAFNEKNYNEAIEYFSKVIKIEPYFAEAYSLRGQSYYKIKNYEKAIDDFTRCTKYDPNNAEAYYWRGRLYYDLDDYNSAISDFSNAIELNPDNTHCYYQRGKTYYLRDKGDDRKKSMYDFKKGCELGHDNSCKALKDMLNL